MTNIAVLKMNMIKALVETIDVSDEEDAKLALKEIRALVGEPKDKA